MLKKYSILIISIIFITACGGSIYYDQSIQVNNSKPIIKSERISPINANTYSLNKWWYYNRSLIYCIRFKKQNKFV
jgi:hypothetical protein